MPEVTTTWKKHCLNKNWVFLKLDPPVWTNLGRPEPILTMPNYWWDNLALMFYHCIMWVYCNLISVDLTSWVPFMGLKIEVVWSYTHWRYVDKEMLYCRSNFGDISSGQLAKGCELGRPQNLSFHHPPLRWHAQLVGALYGLYLGKYIFIELTSQCNQAHV